ELFSDMKAKKESFQGSLKDAVSYGLNIEKDLRVFLDNPYVEMTNNVCLSPTFYYPQHSHTSPVFA
ncbi:MAG: hypothetical protein SOZ75_05395, partial [Candidatus Enterosoma sp.]|nr:hypothetical protein [Candidatus Enterosoma sp.]